MMPCNKIDCNQGRCDCPRDNDRAVVVVVLSILLIVSMGCLVFKLLNGNSGTPCAVEVQFSGGSKAIYIGTSV
jgi:hypothetical protein